MNFHADVPYICISGTDGEMGSSPEVHILKYLLNNIQSSYTEEIKTYLKSKLLVIQTTTMTTKQQQKPES